MGYLIGKGVTVSRHRKLDHWAKEPWFAVVGSKGLYFNQSYHPYKTLGSGLEEVEQVEKEPMSYLLFRFYTSSKNGRSYHERRVPVPYGCEALAGKIVKSIRGLVS